MELWIFWIPWEKAAITPNCTSKRGGCAETWWNKLERLWDRKELRADRRQIVESQLEYWMPSGMIHPVVSWWNSNVEHSGNPGFDSLILFGYDSLPVCQLVAVEQGRSTHFFHADGHPSNGGPIINFHPRMVKTTLNKPCLTEMGLVLGIGDWVINLAWYLWLVSRS